MPLKTVVDWRSQKSGRMLCCVCVCVCFRLVSALNFLVVIFPPFPLPLPLLLYVCGRWSRLVVFAGLIGSAEFLFLFFFCLFVLFSKCQPNLLLLLISSECDRFFLVALLLLLLLTAFSNFICVFLFEVKRN